MSGYTVHELRAMLDAGAVRAVVAVGVPGGWRLLIEPKHGAHGILLSRRRERRFARLDTIGAFLRAEGIMEWSVRGAQYEPSALIV